MKIFKRFKKSALAFLALIICAVLAFLGRGNSDFESPNLTSKRAVQGKADSYAVHFIDVGQGSSVLLQSGTSGILVDAGEAEYGDSVASYILSQGVKELEYVVATHPHTDHIGGMVQVLNRLPVKSIIMPRLTKINTPTTRTYENLLKTVKSKSIKAIAAVPGKSFEVGRVKLELLAPSEQVKDLNNMSVVCKARVNSTDFMLLADAEKTELKTILNKGFNLSCDVLQMGHHGSRTSIDKAFLALASPNTAVISCGKGNSYNHPHEEAIKYLKSAGIKYYRTDLKGTIVFECKDKGYKVR